MKPCVVDASVVAAAFFQEEHADSARSLLASGRDLWAPDLLYAELGNVIWKRCRRGEITEDEADQMLADALRLPLQIVPSRELAETALSLALKTEQTVYDCLYLALAVRTKGVMVSGDKRLVRALAGGPLGKYISWIGENR